MHPGNLDTVLFGVVMVLAGFEGTILAVAAIHAVDPFEVLKSTQFLITAAIAFIAATLAYRSAMAKVLLDRKFKKMEQNGVTEALTKQMLLQAYMAYDLTARVGRNSYGLTQSAVLRKHVLRELSDLMKSNDEVVKSYRDNLRYVTPNRMNEVLDKFVGFVTLANDLRMTHEFMNDWVPTQASVDDDIKGIHYFLALLGQKIINVAFKYGDTIWDEWHEEIETALDKRAEFSDRWMRPAETDDEAGPTVVSDDPLVAHPVPPITQA